MRATVVRMAVALALFMAALILAVLLMVMRPSDAYDVLLWALILTGAGGVVLALPL